MYHIEPQALIESLIRHGRFDLLEIALINASGYAGVLPNGNIVDRRLYNEATPVQENTLLDIPKSKPLPEKGSEDPTYKFTWKGDEITVWPCLKNGGVNHKIGFHSRFGFRWHSFTKEAPIYTQLYGVLTAWYEIENQDLKTNIL